MKTTSTLIGEHLQEKSTIENLKYMILLKADRMDDVSNEYDSYLESSIYPELHSSIRPYFLEKVAELKYGQEMKDTEKELSNMCWHLRKSQGRIPKQTDWQKKYEYATERARIEEVVPRLLNIREIRRNIRCPLHEDKSPSFKIYPNTNKFVCFGCGIRGSPIDFVMQYKHCTFKEAVEYMAFI